jgi:hypothetical protein
MSARRVMVVIIMAASIPIMSATTHGGNKGSVEKGRRERTKHGRSRRRVSRQRTSSWRPRVRSSGRLAGYPA